MLARKFVRNFGSVALQRTNSHFFDPCFVLERDQKIHNGLEKTIFDRMPMLALSVPTPDFISVYFPTKNEEFTPESNMWKNKIQHEYWFRYINKYHIENPTFLKPYGVIDNAFYKKTYHNVEEFRNDVDEFFYN